MVFSTFCGTCTSPVHTMFMLTVAMAGFCVISVTLSCTELLTSFQFTVSGAEEVAALPEPLSLLLLLLLLLFSGLLSSCFGSSGVTVISPEVLPDILAPTPSGTSSVNSRKPFILMVPSAFLVIPPSFSADAVSRLLNQEAAASLPLLLTVLLPSK